MMSVRIAQCDDAAEIHSLVMRAVEPETNSDFDAEGVRYFLKSNALSAIQGRLQSDDRLTLCYIENGAIVGIMALHMHHVIDQLFVDPSHRNKNISTKLWQAAKALCSERGNNGHYQVKSSSMAVPVYQSFGFKLASGLQTRNGISFYNMTLSD
jgi:GNAT superfamily N-acetyltransferase